MIVLQKTSTQDDGWDYRNGLVITIDDKSVVRFYDWEPEDNNLRMLNRRTEPFSFLFVRWENIKIKLWQ